MKKLLLLLSLLISSCVSNEYVIYRDQNPSYVSKSSNVDRLMDATVAIVKGEDEEDFGSTEVLDTRESKNFAFCTGVFVSQTQVLTAHHCIARRKVVQGFFGPSVVQDNDVSPVGDVKKISTRWLMSDPLTFSDYRLFVVTKILKENDLALLEIKQGEDMTFARTFLRVADPKSVTRGSIAFVLGHPLSLPYSLSDGLISKPILKVGEGYYILHSAPVYYGNSGGPLINNNGDLIGIVSMLADTPHLALSVHTDAIVSFLQ